MTKLRLPDGAWQRDAHAAVTPNSVPWRIGGDSSCCQERDHLTGEHVRLGNARPARYATARQPLGVDRIIAAFDLAWQSLPAGALHLVIAGSGPREDALRESVREGVTFLGNLDRAEVLPRLYASADAFLFASLTETLGLVVLEAMSSGLPVIAVPAGGVADHLRDDVNGVACAADDAGDMAAAIVRLALDRARTRRLAAGARLTAEALDWSIELDALDRSYREIAMPEQHPKPLAMHASS